KIRLDKWLWAARFFKTRALAKTAITSGRIRRKGLHCKPSYEPNIGDELSIRRKDEERIVIVQNLSLRRGSASDASLLYSETSDSIKKREEKCLHVAQGVLVPGRPTKRDRRQILHVKMLNHDI
ncbi:UNVERIFIED_CONTAM: hypothetical protein GTU68_039042, partial [Idotea baltica]|nr:hypothetical protein [Idotea baltica]